MIARDLLYALRTLRRSPGYALLCIPVLALGIGANAAIFSVVYSVILRPLPYADPARLVFVWEKVAGLPEPWGSRMQVAPGKYLEWKRQNTVFSGMAAYREMRLEDSQSGHRQISTGLAEPGLFPLLGVEPRLGRIFSSDDAREAVLSGAFFDSRFYGDPAALGKSITLRGVIYTIVGVLPEKFHLPSTDEGEDQLKPLVWVPIGRLWKTAEDEKNRQLLVVARLKPGVSIAAARSEIAGIQERLVQAEPDLAKGWTSSVYSFETEDSSPKLHRALYVLLAAVGLLLLIACANLANLTLARATLRTREIAVRLALGATRARIMSQLASEALLVSFAGAALGLLLAHWCIRLMLWLKPPDIQRPEYIGINVPVFAFAAAIAVLTALLFGLAPSIAASRADLNTALKSGGGWGVSASRARSRQFLIVIEVSLALMLASGAGLMVRSLHEMISLGIGFETSPLTTVDLDPPARRYEDAARSRFFRQVIDNVRAIPGVSGAAVVDNLPLHSVGVNNFYIAGRPDPPANALLIADRASVSPEYFEVIGIKLQTGRRLTDADLAASEDGKAGFAIVNRAFVRQFFPGEEPLGKRLLNGDRKQSWDIVGVVADYRPMGAENGARSEIFVPNLRLQRGTLVVRSRMPRQSLYTEIQNAIWSVDKDIPAGDIKPMDSYLDEWLSQRRFNTLLLGIFAGLALVLAMMGIYGVLSNLVASRVREIGIRMAIGARPGEIGWLVLRQSMIPVAIGLGVGLAGSLALSRFLEALLFQVQPRDPLTLGLAAASILSLSPAAIYLPLRRATRVDCTVALREE